MQKHPTPTARGGDFHWHPADVPVEIRTALTELAAHNRAERAALWIVAPTHAAWARTFTAVAPADRRRYTGLVATLVERDPREDAAGWAAALPAALAAMPLPDARPLAPGDAPPAAAASAPAQPWPAGAPAPVDPDRLHALFRPTDTALADAVCRGGACACPDPHAADLPAAFGALLSWLPPGERARPRAGAFVDRPADAAPVRDSDGRRNLVHYLTLAWLCPEPDTAHWARRARRPGFGRDAWRLVLDLADTLGRDAEALFADLTRVASAWDTADNLARFLAGGVLSAAEIAACDRRAPAPLIAPGVRDAGWLWTRILHYWGRGFLRPEPPDRPEDQLDRLAAVLARRVAIDHLFYLDAPDRAAPPLRYLGRLRYEALLPRGHSRALARAVARYIPSVASPASPASPTSPAGTVAPAAPHHAEASP